MDSGRFDELTRRLATLLDRRRLLGATSAAIAAFGRERGAYAQDECRERCPSGSRCVGGECVAGCDNDRNCRSKHDDPCVLHACVDGSCVAAVIDCLPGHECCGGSCCPSGCVSDADCVLFGPCQWGRCGADGQCEFLDIDPCTVCLLGQDCAGEASNTVCCGGMCRRGCPEGTFMGKGCECGTDGSATLEGIVVRDDASG